MNRLCNNDFENLSFWIKVDFESFWKVAEVLYYVQSKIFYEIKKNYFLMRYWNCKCLKVAKTKSFLHKIS